MKERHRRLAEAVAFELERVPLVVLEGGRGVDVTAERDAAFCRAAARAGWPRRFSNPGKLARFVAGVVRLPDVSEVVTVSLLERWRLATGDPDPLATYARDVHEIATSPKTSAGDRRLSLRALKLALEMLLPADPEARREVFAAAWRRGCEPAIAVEQEAKAREFAFHCFSEGWNAAIGEIAAEDATSVA